ncbi:MAG: hypothetical protein WCB18_09045 [Thermoplasmata archaeon]
MRPILSAVVVALVLLTGAFVSIAPTLDHNLTHGASSASGVRSSVVPTYEVGLDVTNQPVLPGYHDTLWWDVANDTNDAPILTLSTITILGTYYNNADQLLKMPGTPVNVSTTPINSWSFLVPANSSDVPGFLPVLTVWANSTSLGMNQSNSIEVLVGSLVIGDDSVCSAVTGCGALTVGNPATVSVTADVLHGEESPAPNETAKILFYSTGSSPVTVPGVPATLTTNAQGVAAVTFTPSSTIFNVPGPNRVEIEVTDSVNTSLTVYANVTWNLYNPSGTLNFAFFLNSATYYSGQTVTATWQSAGTNSTIGPINVTNYLVLDLTDHDNVIGDGVIESTAATGTFHFVLGPDYVGEFGAILVVHNSSDEFAFIAEAESYAAVLLVTPSEYYFNPGDTVTATVTGFGPALTGATISAFVQATDSGQTLYNGTVTGGSFQFLVPAVAPADEYEIYVWASTSTGGTIAQADNYIDEAYGYSLWVGVTTVSPYSDGSFAPGQVVQVGWKVIAQGTTPLPTAVEIEICSLGCDYGSPAYKEYIETGSSGSVAFTIPAGTPDGPQVFALDAAFLGGGGVENLFTVIVNSSPSALNYELVGDSGLTVAWLILLVLVIVVAIVLVMMRRRNKPTMVMSPTASGSAPEWKEPASSAPASGSGNTPSTPPGAQ